jgi:hypothetical protein
MNARRKALVARAVVALLASLRDRKRADVSLPADSKAIEVGRRG